jgi:hypothetical protein
LPFIFLNIWSQTHDDFVQSADPFVTNAVFVR